MRRQTTSQIANGLSIAQVIDRLGEVLEAKRALEAQEKELKAKLLALVDNQMGKYEGNIYTATISLSRSAEYDPDKVISNFPPEILAKIIKVTSDIKKYVAPVDLEQFVREVNEKVMIRVEQK